MEEKIIKPAKFVTSREKAESLLSSKLRFALTISGLTIFLVGCSKQPTESSDMSEKIASITAEIQSNLIEESQSEVKLESGFLQALLLSVEANEGYKSALMIEREAFDQIGVTASVRRAQIAGTSTIGGIHENGGAAPDATTSGIAASITVSQLLYDGGASAAAIDQATASALAARAEREVLANDLALEAARAWIDTWQFDERLRLLTSRTQDMNEMIGQMERMASNGFIDKATLESTRRQIVGISIEEARIQADLRDAKVRFKRFFNQEPSTEIDLPETITSYMVREAAKVWGQSPMIERSGAELLMARSAVANAEAAFRPRARFQAGLTSPMKATDSTDTSIGVVLEYQFSDGGRRLSQLASAQAHVAAIEEQLKNIQQMLQSEIEASLARIAAIEQSSPLVAEQIELSASEALTARSQITTGQSNLRQLFDAEIENYRARDRYIEMQAARQILLLTVMARTGQLSQTIGLASDRSVAVASVNQDE